MTVFLHRLQKFFRHLPGATLGIVEFFHLSDNPQRPTLGIREGYFHLLRDCRFLTLNIFRCLGSFNARLYATKGVKKQKKTRRVGVA